ncbi:hypothetical protein DFR86_07500 [Acidianus sulfidivorans JP7]|uniref:Uncharacterized protein n=1 Tax=Acidianus sulfidivorans JP7 TaxID=619593 RepID=A0A2U9IN00_9CREN|nr:hypothetical protein [Acidianus sulfidivorans]AWR97408.1 hypothetical protein DFR86_07500 [Acidianus sulfidivorans JP7]
MKLFGYNIDSVLTPEAKYVVTSRYFLDTLAEAYPAVISLNLEGKILRELVFIKQSRLKGRTIQEGYKYEIESHSDGRLNSLSKCEKIILGIKAKKISNINAITTQLRFFGFKKGNLERLLIIHDVPIIAKDKKDLFFQIQKFLNEWNVKVDNIPGLVLKKEESKVTNSKIIDLDYLSLPL